LILAGVVIGGVAALQSTITRVLERGAFDRRRRKASAAAIPAARVIAARFRSRALSAAAAAGSRPGAQAPRKIQAGDHVRGGNGTGHSFKGTQ
jgi:hypothetical protein